MSNAERSELRGKSGRTGLGCSIAAGVLLLLLLAGAALGAPRLMAFLNNGSAVDTPLTAGAAHGLLVEQQSGAIAQLNSYGWVDEDAGIARVPIERAVTLLAAGALPVGAVGAATESTDAAEVDLSNVDFTDDVLPIFMEHCAECHGDDDPEEGLVLTSYQDVMAGSFYGAVIIPNDVEGSYLVELVETGQMPKRGDDLTPEEINTIVAWVEAGAPESGSGDNGDGGSPEEVPKEVIAVTPETVSFQEHVLPLFVEYCGECHGDDNPEEGLVLTSYQDVMLGSFYGSVVKPNDVEGSYLMELVETGQMPKRGEDLNQAQIDLIVAWIEAGTPDN